MTSIAPAQCLACTRLDRTGAVSVAGSCTAYPRGIPVEIAVYGQDHRRPRGDEDQGLVFDQIDSTAGRAAWSWWRQTFD